MSHVIEGRSDNFDQEVIGSEQPVLVDFYADWCGPCRRLAPMLESLAAKVDGKAKVIKVNVEEQAELAATYKIQTLPTLIFFKDGEVVDQHSGLISQGDLEDRLLGL